MPGYWLFATLRMTPISSSPSFMPRPVIVNGSPETNPDVFTPTADPSTSKVAPSETTVPFAAVPSAPTSRARR